MLRSVETCADSTNNLPIDGGRETAFHLDEVARRDGSDPAVIDGIL
jgi:hypothetical protein